MPTLIYVLRSDSSRGSPKYYIGKTDRDVNIRFNEHVVGTGCAWTRAYKPTQIVEVVEQLCDTDEDTYTKKYMYEHGIDNVRGGSYCLPDLPPWSILALKHEICTAKNLCFKCMGPGHLSKECRVWLQCKKCGKSGHLKFTCFVKNRSMSIPLIQAQDDNYDDDHSNACCCVM